MIKKIISILSLFPLHNSLKLSFVDKFKNLLNNLLIIKKEPKMKNNKYIIGTDIDIQTIG